MNSTYRRDQEIDDDEGLGGRDREISLGTSFIIGIFFALALICAVFFAFGYSLGRRSTPASSVPAPVTDAVTSSNSKPASGIPEARPASLTSSSDNDSANSDSGSVSPNSTDESASSATTNPVAPAPRASSTVVLPTKVVAKPAPIARPAAPLSAATPGATQSVVQVAAVSRQGDAAMLMSALKRKGYNAAIHQESQDKLLHIQIGPFATKKDAEAMRQRLISDGYNAIVK